MSKQQQTRSALLLHKNLKLLNPEKPSPKEQGAPHIEQYSDYRAFLAAHYEFKKKVNPRFSYRVWARLLSLNSPTYMKMIINGERKFPLEKVPALAKACDLNENAGEYLRALIRWNDCDDQEMKPKLWEELLLCSSKCRPAQLSSAEVELLSGWRLIVIMEILKTSHEPQSAEWVKSKLLPDLEMTDVEKALERLVELGYVSVVDGNFLATQDITLRKVEIPSQVTRSFHQSTISLGLDILQRPDEDKRRRFVATTLSIPISELPQLIKDIENWNSKMIHKYSEKGPHEDVYQFNLQLFPVTRRKAS